MRKKKRLTENLVIKETGDKKILIRLKSRFDRRNIIKAAILLAVILVFIFVRKLNIFEYWFGVEDVALPSEEYVIPRDDAEGKAAVTLGSGTFFAGADIPAGRYSATTEKGYGSFVVYETGTKLPEISEVLGYFADVAYVQSVAVTLGAGQEIEIKGLSRVTFTPLRTELRTELTTGVWEAGTDIKPGTYKVSSLDGRSGSITVLSGSMPAAIAYLGENGTKSKESAVITLTEGQTIRISSIPAVVFEPA